ncbi:hypothetical protein C4578_01015 [Candidatus Microgenomates bacterium]|jgi:hypothetical protein|nr:MAG: hypothetical protein C4578_01015 [Candidatus Microgenomates bacterium]
MDTKINEKVRVVCLFENGRIKPFVFSWRNRNYKILQTVFIYSKNIGSDKITYFSVDTGNAVFELAFNQQKFSWEITKIF